MEQDVRIFNAVNTQSEQGFWIGLIVFVLAVLATWLLLRRHNRKPRKELTLLALLSFIVAMLAGGTALFSKLTSTRIGPVTLTAETIETPYGTAQLSELQNAYIEMDQRKSLINPNITTDRVRLLLIIEDDGKTHVLSEANYPVEEILAALKKRVPQKE